MAFTYDAYFDALCFSKGGKKIRFDNIVQKASTPISKINGKTSQSEFSNLSASTLEPAAVSGLVLSFPSTCIPPSQLSWLRDAGDTAGRQLLTDLKIRMLNKE